MFELLLLKFIYFRKLDSTDADSSTDLKDKPVALPSSNQNMTKNIINYANDSLSIASVVSNSPTQPMPATVQAIPVSAKMTPPANSKISLVPTKLLLKQQTVNSFKSAPTIVYSSVQSSTPVTGTVTTNAQSSIPMKVVFVNALNNNANAQHSAVNKPQQITLNNKSLAQLQQHQHQQQQNSALMNKFISTSQGQKVQFVQTPQFTSVPKVTTTVSNGETNHVKSNKGSLKSKLPGKSLAILICSLFINALPLVIRNLLTNIVEIENQRLEIEKQRFEYEKTVGNELLTMLRTFVGSHAKAENHQMNETSE